MLPLRTGISQECPSPPDSGGSHFLSPPSSCNRRVFGGSTGRPRGRPCNLSVKTGGGCFQIKDLIVLIYFCAVLAGGPRYMLSWKTMHPSLFSREPRSRLAWLTKGPLWGPAVGGRRQAGGASPSPPAAPSFHRQTQDVQGPDSRCRPWEGGAGLWAAKAPPVRRSRCGTGPKGATDLGATVQMGGSQVFPVQQIAYGRQRGTPTLTHTSHQKQI